MSQNTKLFDVDFHSEDLLNQIGVTFILLDAQGNVESVKGNLFEQNNIDFSDRNIIDFVASFEQKPLLNLLKTSHADFDTVLTFSEEKELLCSVRFVVKESGDQKRWIAICNPLGGFREKEIAEDIIAKDNDSDFIVWNLLSNTFCIGEKCCMWLETGTANKCFTRNELSLYLHPDERKGAIADLAVFLENREEYFKNTYRFISVSGQSIWLEIRFVRMSSESQVLRGIAKNITSTHQLEDKLNVSTSNLSQVFKYLMSGLFVVDVLYSEKGDIVDFKYIATNRITLEIFNKKEGFFLNRKLSELYPDRVSFWINIANKVIDEGERYFRIHYFESINKHLELTVFPFDKSQLVLIFKDVSEEIRAKKALAEREKEFRVLVENMEDMVIRFDRDARHLYCNPATLQAFNMKQEAIVGKTHLEAGFDEKMSHFWDEIIKDVVKEKKPQFVEFDWQHDNGKSVVDWRLYPELDDQGEINSVISVARDVTEQKRKEIDLMDALNQIQYSEAKYRTLIESAEDRIALFNSQGEIILANNAYYSILGYTKEEYALRKDLHWFNAEVIAKLTENNGSNGKAFKYEFRSRHKDGKWLHMVAKLVLVRNVKDIPIGFLSIIRDETEKKEYEKKLIRARLRAERAEQLKAAFLANFSHEIRTPLNMINGFTNIILEETKAGEDTQGYASIVSENTEKLILMVNNIIDMAKLTSGELSLSPEVIDVISVLKSFSNIQELKLKNEKRLTLNLSVECDDSVKILADESRLCQVFECLIDNAVKFTEEGQITMGVKDLVSHLIFYVRDTGIGIEKEKQKLIFEPFVQGENSKTKIYEGAGVTLSLAKKLVQLMGGELKVESVYGEGSKFYFKLPKWKEEKSEGRSNIIQVPDKWNEKTILIVDDMVANYELMAALLKKTKVNIVYVESSEKAISKIKELEKVDLLLLDLILPQKDGFELAKEIRNFNTSVPIIIHTAYDNQKLKKIKKSGLIDEIIPKPFDSKKLISRIGELLYMNPRKGQ
ncbi:PAS domain-containing sensor histidine kinase [Prolixibacteraceae bacterium JC049]|nr:PAS domain-containing sensor histidine kinase [Prolixibacteraceae bacterium JC049]